MSWRWGILHHAVSKLSPQVENRYVDNKTFQLHLTELVGVVWVVIRQIRLLIWYHYFLNVASTKTRILKGEKNNFWSCCCLLTVAYCKYTVLQHLQCVQKENICLWCTDGVLKWQILEMLKCWIIIILVWNSSQWEISGGRGRSERLGMCQACGSALAYIVQLASRRGSRSLPAFKELPDWPAAAQMERPHWVCTQDGSHNATILLGSMITTKEGMRGVASTTTQQVLNGEDTGLTLQWEKYLGLMMIVVFVSQVLIFF